MPHIPRHEKDAIIDKTLFPTTPGQICWLFAKLMLEMYNNDPRWSTIHEIRKVARNPWLYQNSKDTIIRYCGSFPKEDIDTAADLAFFEFYRIVIAAHEDVKIRTNGNALEGANIPHE